jgi:hypothetical protein
MGSELTPELLGFARPAEEGVGDRWRAYPRSPFQVASSVLSGGRCARKRYSLCLTARAVISDFQK